MYLETGAVAPYCKHHYLLQLHLAKPRQAEAWVQVRHIQLIIDRISKHLCICLFEFCPLGLPQS